MTSFRMTLSRRSLLATPLLGVPLLAALPAHAQAWPARAVHIVVPFARLEHQYMPGKERVVAAIKKTLEFFSKINGKEQKAQKKNEE